MVNDKNFCKFFEDSREVMKEEDNCYKMLEMFIESSFEDFLDDNYSEIHKSPQDFIKKLISESFDENIDYLVIIANLLGILRMRVLKDSIKNMLEDVVQKLGVDMDEAEKAEIH